PGALDELQPLLDDPNDRVRAAAVRALSALQPEQVIPLLLRALERYDVVAAEAVSALASIGEPAVLPLSENCAAARPGRAGTRRGRWAASATRARSSRW